MSGMRGPLIRCTPVCAIGNHGADDSAAFHNLNRGDPVLAAIVGGHLDIVRGDAIAAQAASASGLSGRRAAAAAFEAGPVTATSQSAVDVAAAGAVIDPLPLQTFRPLCAQYRQIALCTKRGKTLGNLGSNAEASISAATTPSTSAQPPG
jgi:hypothetical protein